MHDAVIDTTVVAFANCDIAARKEGNSLDKRLEVLETAVNGGIRIRYNDKLITEYADHVRDHINDVIAMFFALLDSAAAIRAKKSTLSRQHYERAVRVRWPTHDQHLLAAAIGGHRPVVYVTEPLLSNCAAGIHRIFKIHVYRV